MRILVLSFYFEPDLCAGSFRNSVLVKELSKKLTDEDIVEVITTEPNRYHTYAVSAPENEVIGNIKIHRILLPAHKNGIFGQSRAFMSYILGVLKLTQNQSYEIVYASSGRLMTAFLATLVARRERVPLYLDIRDIFTDNIKDLYSHSPVRLLLPLFKYIERFSIRSAARVNLVSPGFIEHFRKINPTKTFRVFTNGIDQINNDDFLDEVLYYSEYKEILYAGNIGDGQGLHRIIPIIATRLPPSWRIRIIGDGSARSILEAAISGLDNVILEGPVARSALVNYYRAAAVLFVHLNDHSVFEKVIPSKLFEYAASGKPVLAGLNGLAAAFVRDNIDNSAVFPACDADGFLKALEILRLENTPRDSFCRQYRRSYITDKMSDDILNLYRNPLER